MAVDSSKTGEGDPSGFTSAIIYRLKDFK